MADRTPTPDEVREVVARVVARHLAGDTGDAPGERPQDVATDGDSLGTLAIGADHGGFALKERLAADLRDRGYTVHDCGTRSTDAVDYPDIAHEVAHQVATGACRLGIVIDGAGIGSAIAANKVPGIRAATCWDISSARNSREHNHANVLSLGAGLLGENLARDIVYAWLSTTPGLDRHARRVAKIGQLEARYGTRPA
ncbi:MAG TPA: ribose 5-phosphate isomerase B [Egicoccus sp.]|nr:ribose 5-phosphate isomerase B [Egicoccus sp.]HSK21800.1 ribose 5-phosphate isomerase B [Egicoccus sp.]